MRLFGIVLKDLDNVCIKVSTNFTIQHCRLEKSNIFNFSSCFLQAWLVWPLSLFIFSHTTYQYYKILFTNINKIIKFEIKKLLFLKSLKLECRKIGSVQYLDLELMLVMTLHRDLLQLRNI